jgi:glycosyltransferase involved in cell wall biosynthesis
LKILFLSHSFYPAIGGIETISEFLACAFNTAKHEVHLVTWTREEGEKSFPFKIIRNPSVIQLLKEHSWSDLIFENNPSIRLGWPALIFPRPRIVALHTWIARINGKIGWQDKLKLQWLLKARVVLAASDALRKHSWPSATVIENPYRKDIFKTISNIPKTNGFVFLGRLVSNKGANLAIKALFNLINEYDKKNTYGSILTLTIIGNGPEDKRLANLVAELKLKDRVQFKGTLSGEKLVEELNRHQFILVPSLWQEPFGIVALEGMACGCIPIASDGGGLVDAVGNAGAIFKRGDVESLVEVIKQLLENPVRVQELKDNAPAHLAAHQPEIIAKQYLKVIESAFAEKE